jgi:hypothetical protein
MRFSRSVFSFRSLTQIGLSDVMKTPAEPQLMPPNLKGGLHWELYCFPPGN